MGVSLDIGFSNKDSFFNKLFEFFFGILFSFSKVSYTLRNLFLYHPVISSKNLFHSVRKSKALNTYQLYSTGFSKTDLARITLFINLFTSLGFSCSCLHILFFSKLISSFEPSRPFSIICLWILISLSLSRLESEMEFLNNLLQIIQFPFYIGICSISF